MNRISTLLLLFGASAYVLYKLSHLNLRMNRISNKFWQVLGYEVNKLEPVFFKNKLNPTVEFNETKLRRSGCFDTSDVPDLDLALPKTPKSPFFNQLEYYYNNNYSFSDKFSPDFSFNDNNFNYSSTSAENMTVMKIDEVLTQIDDIKKSLVDIDSQLFHVSGSKCANFNPDFFTLTNADFLENDDLIDSTVSSSQEPKTPFQELNLEWDLTDVDNESLFFSNEVKVDSALSLPVTDSDKQKIKSMQELFEDAKQMGLLNNILDAISTKAQNRDSAYFEE